MDQLNFGDTVKVISGFWKDAQGTINAKANTEEFGFDVITEHYGHVTLWVRPENLEKVKKG